MSINSPQFYKNQKIPELLLLVGGAYWPRMEMPQDSRGQ